jgi:TRAP-type C4-dicarboxylate transport system permease small subunit
MKRIFRVFDLLLDFLPLLMGAIIIIMMLGVSLNVILRYFFNLPISGLEEVTEYFLLFITLIGAAWLLREDGHVRVDILLVRLNWRNQAILGFVSSLMGVFLSAILTWYGLQVTYINFQRGAYYPSLLEFPKAPILAIIPLGSFLLLIQFLRRSAGFLRSRRPGEEEGTPLKHEAKGDES